MKTIKYTYDYSDYNTLSGCLTQAGKDNDLCFFDIETTGLSANNSTLYLIGVLVCENDSVNLTQWFNDDGYSEEEIINSFCDFCSNHNRLIHFNGNTFDIPYLKEKCKKHGINDESFTTLTQLDIYKEIRSYKKIFSLDSMRQVAIEEYLGIARDDTYSGKELINIYQRYIARPDEEKEKLLLLHNHDDLLGMLKFCDILNYKAFFKNPHIMPDLFERKIEKNKLVLDFVLEDTFALPKRLLYTSTEGIFVNACGTSAHLEIPILNEALKHYFVDYKNYYYLPKEDMALHKSVATYVESENRVKATKENCYVKKEARFVVCPEQNIDAIFKKDIKDKMSYCIVNSILSADINKLNIYVSSILKLIIK
ncbi:MAG: ribonuclease H-like domain-containing protein [Lachnospiraceae bacterium]|nr:ribonuclease H-like domain-containing protein [Lachnospiraceae bacterium]